MGRAGVPERERETREDEVGTYLGPTEKRLTVESRWVVPSATWIYIGDIKGDGKEGGEILPNDPPGDKTAGIYATFYLHEPLAYLFRPDFSAP